MTVHRFFVEPEAIAGDRFPLPASIERQVRRVLRLTDGDRLIVTERSVAREVSARRLERLRAIAREAAEQSERGVVPAVDGPIGLADAFEPDAGLLFERNEGRRLRDVAPPPTSILIGPEGGFSAA